MAVEGYYYRKADVKVVKGTNFTDKNKVTVAENSPVMWFILMDGDPMPWPMPYEFITPDGHNHAGKTG
jgi:hypothetical protein